MNQFTDEEMFEVEEEGDLVDIVRCGECDATFEVSSGEEPTHCPECGIAFD